VSLRLGDIVMDIGCNDWNPPALLQDSATTLGRVRTAKNLVEEARKGTEYILMTSVGRTIPT